MGVTRKFLRAVGLTAAVALSAALLAGAPARTAEAADLSQFRPGLIISDAVFYNSGAMSEAAIQAFLESKVPACEPGYTCLRDFRETTTTRGADAMCRQYTGGPNETAARIIAKVAQACGINPQVLLATLQKEQSLVTSAAPSAGRYRIAMGYACPDTAECDARYFGFFNQMYSAAWQFIRYSNPPGTSNFFTWYPVGRVSNVQFHPNAACGSTPVLIENKATAALYYYTPYQPNGAALAAGYNASSDPCSSYGNRNFYQFFVDWFGSTYSIGESAIDTAYLNAGGQQGALGAPVTGYVNHQVNGGGIVRGYANGAIAWSSARGAWILSGDFRAQFNAIGGISGSLGWPASNVNSYELGIGGRVQSFMGGALVHTDEYGFVVLDGAIRNAYNAAGGLTGPLGWPTAAKSCTGTLCTVTFERGTIVAGSAGSRVEIPAISDLYASMGGASGALGSQTGTPVPQNLRGGGYVQAYRNGAIAFSSSGAFAISGPIRTALAAAGGIAGYLGWPTGAASCDAGGCSQQFAGGLVTTDPAGSTQTMHSEIRALYVSLGGTQSPLGGAIGDSIAQSVNGGGYVQPFQNGVITWSPAVGAAVLSEPIRSVFNANGGLAGRLGWPTGSVRRETANGGGDVQGFQGAAIASSTAGTYVVEGDIRTHFGAEGGLTGRLGWPTSPLRAEGANGGGRVQAFQGGAVTAAAGGVPITVSGVVRTTFNEYGGLAGALGWPTSAERTESANGGGTVQGFQGAAIASSIAGAFVLRDGIRATYNANGGLTGSIGWPTAGEECNATRTSCTQPFQNGTITWTQTGGGVVDQP